MDRENSNSRTIQTSSPKIQSVVTLDDLFREGSSAYAGHSNERKYAVADYFISRAESSSPSQR